MCEDAGKVGLCQIRNALAQQELRGAVCVGLSSTLPKKVRLQSVDDLSGAKFLTRDIKPNSPGLRALRGL
jgi:hypothetical protein